MRKVKAQVYRTIRQKAEVTIEVPDHLTPQSTPEEYKEWTYSHSCDAANKENNWEHQLFDVEEQRKVYVYESRVSK
jgi:hypothetical protein